MIGSDEVLKFFWWIWNRDQDSAAVGLQVLDVLSGYFRCSDRFRLASPLFVLRVVSLNDRGQSDSRNFLLTEVGAETHFGFSQHATLIFGWTKDVASVETELSFFLASILLQGFGTVPFDHFGRQGNQIYPTLFRLRENYRVKHRFGVSFNLLLLVIFALFLTVLKDLLC